MIFFLFILGLAVGSFLNVCADRLSHEKSILGRSSCDYCKKKLAPIDLIPVLSFLLQKGRCRYCKKKLSFYYPLVEIVTGLTYVFLFFSVKQPVVETVLYFGLFSVLIAVFFSDLKYQIIPDELQIALFLFALAIFLVRNAGVVFLGFQTLQGLVVAAPMYLLYRLTKRKGMGFADVKLAFTMGFFLGWLWGFVALYLGFVFGAVIGITLLISRQKKWKSKIAFGPFLVLGTAAVILFSKAISTILSYLKIG